MPDRKKIVGATVIVVLAVVSLSIGLVLYQMYKVAMCSGQLYYGVMSAMVSYSFDYDDKLPPGDRWCDLLVEEGLMTPEGLQCRGRMKKGEKVSHFMMNKHLADAGDKRLRPDAVFIFEGKEGWNQVGGPEDVEAHHFGKCLVLFADYQEPKMMTVEEAKDLNWTDVFLEDVDAGESENGEGE